MILAILAACAGWIDEDNNTDGRNGRPANSPTGGTQDSGGSGSETVVTGVPRLTVVSRTEFEGMAHFPISGSYNGQPGAFITTSYADNTTHVAFVNPANDRFKDIAVLPQGSGRSYMEGATQLSNGTLAWPYQSTSGFMGETGLDQGIAFVSTSTGYVLDRNFYDKGLTRAESIVETGGSVFASFTNGDITTASGIIGYDYPSSLLSLPVTDLEATPTITTLAGGFNVSSLSLMGDGDDKQLVTAATGGSVLDNGTSATVTILNPETQEIENTWTLPGGNGMEMDVQGDRILSSGTTFSGDSISLIDASSVYEQLTLNTYDLAVASAGSLIYGDSWVVDAVFGPENSILATVEDPSGANLAVINPDTQEIEVFDLLESSSVSTTAVVDGDYCIVQSGTRAATEEEIEDGMIPGSAFSELICYGEE